MLPTGLSRSLPFVLVGLLSVVPARAQDFIAPPYIALVDGQATLTHEGEAESATTNMPLVAGDSIVTGNAGRLEILWPDGSTLDLDQYSRLDVLAPTLFRLLDGQLLFTVAGTDNPSQAIRYQVDTPVASLETNGPGEYRLSALTYREGPGTQLAVFRGDATFWNERGTVRVAAGEQSFARDQEGPSYAVAFNSAQFDAFDRWAQSIHGARTSTATARQYLPPELQMYGSELDRAGVWRYDASYGYVWYPWVAPAWRPYYYGRWVGLPTYGWTWVGVDLWSWPTHHYGRWGCRNGAWFWIPGRIWGSAWVSWASATSYVAWSPLGFDNRPVFALSVGIGFPNSWVYVPRNRFGHAWHADRYAIAPDRLPHRTTFVSHRNAPVAVPRVSGRAVATAPVPRPLPRNRTSLNADLAPARSPAPSRAIPRASSRAPVGPTTSRQRAPETARPNGGVEGQVPRVGSRAPSATGSGQRGAARGIQGRARGRATPPPPQTEAAPPTISREPRTRAAPGSEQGSGRAGRRPAPSTRSPRSSSQVEAPRSSPRAEPRPSAPRADSPRFTTPRPEGRSSERARSGSAAPPARSAPAGRSRGPAASERSGGGSSSRASGRAPSRGAPSGRASSGSAQRSNSSERRAGQRQR
jgi:hypothetical protein